MAEGAGTLAAETSVEVRWVAETSGGGVVVVVVGLTVEVGLTEPVTGGLTLPLADWRPGGIEKGSRSPASSTGGSVSRGVGDGVTVGTTTGPELPVGSSGSAASSPPPFSTNR